MTDSPRVNIGKQHPAAYKALIALSSEAEVAVAAAGLISSHAGDTARAAEVSA